MYEDAHVVLCYWITQMKFASLISHIKCQTSADVENSSYNTVMSSSPSTLMALPHLTLTSTRQGFSREITNNSNYDWTMGHLIVILRNISVVDQILVTIS